MRKILVAGGLTAAAVAAVIGAASTNSISGVTAKTVGYSSANIDSPAAVSTLAYNVDSTADDQLNSVTITFATSVPVGDKIQLAVDPAKALTACLDTNTDSSGVVQTAGTSFTCTLSSQTATGATQFRLLVTN